MSEQPSAQIPEELRHLDFDPGPIPCNCHRHGPEGCSGTAAKKLLLHALHDCKERLGVPGGNIIQLMCETCLRETMQMASQLIAQWQFKLGPDMAVKCNSCSRPLEHVDDLMKVVELYD